MASGHPASTEKQLQQQQQQQSGKVRPGLKPLDGQGDIITTTANSLPGYRILRVLGVVTGVTVRSRNILVQVFTDIKSLFGGELAPYTELVKRVRSQALDRLMQECSLRGGNAITRLRFDESSAYGTACVVEKIDGDGGGDNGVKAPSQDLKAK